MPRSRHVDPVVEELRVRLEAIDRSLVLGLRAREQTQQELFAYKRLAGIALYDPGQERVVKRRARQWAEECGADPDLAEKVVAGALASGRRRFRTAPADPRPSASPVVVLLPLEPPPPFSAASPTRVAPAILSSAGR